MKQSINPKFDYSGPPYGDEPPHNKGLNPTSLPMSLRIVHLVEVDMTTNIHNVDERMVGEYLVLLKVPRSSVWITISRFTKLKKCLLWLTVVGLPHPRVDTICIG